MPNIVHAKYNTFTVYVKFWWAFVCLELFFFMLIYANLSLLDRTWCILEWFLAQLSWKLKWALLIAWCPSSILASYHPSVCLSVYPSANFSHFHLLRGTTGPISTKLGTKYPLLKRIQGPCPNQREDNWEKVKIHWKPLKIFFSRTPWPISTIPGTKHPWVKGIQICSKKLKVLLIRIIQFSKRR